MEEVKKRIIDELEISFENHPLDNPGGQHVNIPPNIAVTLYSEEMDIKITVGYHRSRTKNKELALTLFELALDEVIK